MQRRQVGPLGLWAMSHSSISFHFSRISWLRAVQGLHRAKSDLELHRKDASLVSGLSLPCLRVPQECTEDDMGQANLSRASKVHGPLRLATRSLRSSKPFRLWTLQGGALVCIVEADIYPWRQIHACASQCELSVLLASRGDIAVHHCQKSWYAPRAVVF